MAVSITLTKKTVNADGSIQFQFSDGVSFDFPNQSVADQFISQSTADAMQVDNLRRFLVGWSGRNGVTVNKTATYDILQPSGNIIRIQ